MTSAFQAIPLSDTVYWVGAIDWSLREFHGYTTQRGTTYNAYLIVADKITLIDGVKAPFTDELLARVASVVDPARVDYIVSNHSEMDHSGALPAIIRAVSPEKVFASKNGVKALADHFGMDNVTAVADGEALSLGNRTLVFLETKMLHWPDSMVSYLKEEAMLFSQDAFGMHLADPRMFAERIPEDVLEWEARKYFANILMPYSPLILKALDRIAGMNLPFRTVAPDHGPIWRNALVGWPLERYRHWSGQKPERRAVVVYDTMWHSTALMARCIGEGLRDAGVDFSLLPLSANSRSDVATEILGAGALLVGSPTINGQIYPALADILCYLKGLRPQHLIGGAFGSYGWGGEAVKQLNAMLAEMNVEVVHDGIRCRYVPKTEDQQACREFGQSVGQSLVERLKQGK
jgi:flavorubredoxin